MQQQAITSKAKTENPDKLANNPYLQSRAMWNELYGSVQQRLENSYRLIALLAFVLTVAIIGLIALATQSQIKPYVALIHGDEVITLDNQAFQQLHTIEPKIALLNLKRFIRHSRKFSIDPTVNRENTLTAFSLSTGGATNLLKAFFKERNQQASASNLSNQIHINSILRLSDKTFSIRWSEQWIDSQSGKPQSSKQYIAELSYKISAPSNNPVILKHNPFGFYITHLTWSEDTNV